MSSGSIDGSSPWTLTTTSQSIAEATSAIRLVPFGWSARVIATSPPKARTASAIRRSSVATMIRESRRERAAASQTCRMSGLPVASASGLPGNRTLAKRAGMIATMAGDAVTGVSRRVP
jgi:hypothetical protein